MYQASALRVLQFANWPNICFQGYKLFDSLCNFYPQLGMKENKIFIWLVSIYVVHAFPKYKIT